MQIAVGTIVAGKYELERPLARGGMGSVWVARHVKLGSRLAVKFLDPRFASSASFIDRFEREARAAASLHNPNVVHVQDYGVDETTPYLVMELLQGEDLDTRLKRVQRLSLYEAASILVQVGKALRKAHDAGIVHRDLKPANLFLSRIDEDEEVVKVLDFGIAKETVGAVGHETKTGEVMGSPHYMSPEQARADKGLDHRADLWAVGVILYRMVTGALPFTGEVLGAILSRILVDPVPPVATVAPDLPPSLDAFFARAMAKSKEERFQSIRELVDAFVQIAGGGRASLASHVSLGTSSPDIQASPAAPSPPPVVAPPSHPTPSSSALSGPSAASSSALPGSMSGLPTVPLSATLVLPTPISGGGAGTLTNASVTGELHAPPAGSQRRSVTPWLIGGTVLVLLIFGILIQYNLTTSSDQAKTAAEPGISTSEAEPAASSAPASGPAAPVEMTAAPESSSAPVEPTSAPVATGDTDVQTGSPSSTASSVSAPIVPSSKRGTVGPSGPAPASKPKSTGGWGF